mgnify:CR=1 FL=1
MPFVLLLFAARPVSGLCVRTVALGLGGRLGLTIDGGAVATVVARCPEKECS